MSATDPTLWDKRAQEGVGAMSIATLTKPGTTFETWSANGGISADPSLLVPKQSSPFDDRLNNFHSTHQHRSEPDTEVFLGTRLISDRSSPSGYREIELTAYDLLHPLEGDNPVHELWHAETTSRLFRTLKARRRRIPRSLVLNDQGVKWKPGFSHSPDISFFLNAPSDFDAATLNIRDTQAQIQFILEAVSHSTTKVETNDTVDKVKDYFEVGVPQYILIDREKVKGQWVAKLTNYVRGQQGYIIGPWNERHHIALHGTDFFLGEYPPDHNDLTPIIGLFDAQGNMLKLSPEEEEIVQNEIDARIAAEERAQNEIDARIAAENKAKTAEDKVKAAENKAKTAEKAREQLEAKLRELGIPIPTMDSE